MTTAIARREDQHPLVQAIDDRMPQIAAVLPDGMRPERFRKVVVQALSRNPDLLSCTPVSVVTAISEAAEVGIEPTGVLGKGWLIPYKREAKFVAGWRGLVDLCWRADRMLLTPELVRQGDHFEYRRGTGAYLHHVPVLDDPERERDDSNITFAYVLVRFPDGREDFEVMSRADIERIRDRARFKNPVWDSDFGEMCKKTPIRRIAKRLPLSPAAQRVFAGEEEVDFDTPVERIAVAPRQALASGIRARTQALESGTRESPSEVVSMPEAGDVPPVPASGASSTSERAAPAPDEAATHEHVGAVVEDDGLYCECGELVAKRQPKARTRRAKAKQPGDKGYGTARAHAVAAERGLDHDAVHRIAYEFVRSSIAPSDFSVATLTEEQWSEIIAAISEAPQDVEDDESTARAAESFAGRMALQAGIGSGDDPWTEADPMLAEMFGHGDPYSAAELIEFGIRVYARNPLP